MSRTSIIIPTFNHSKFIEQAVKSSLFQTCQEIEVIVVDDGSTDKTKEILQPYFKQIHYIYQENMGLSAARNTGIKAASGDYYLFLDADDWIPPQKIELQAAFLDQNPQYGLVYSAWNFVDEETNQIIGEVRPFKQGMVLEDLLLRKFYFPSAAALVRNECFSTVGYFDENIPGKRSEDMDIWVRIADAGFLFAYLDEPLFYYRIVKNSMSKNHAKQAESEIARLEKFFKQKSQNEKLKKLKQKALGSIHFEFSAKYYHLGEFTNGKSHLIEAIKTSPELAQDTEWLLEWIAGFCLDPQVKDPKKFIYSFFKNLPEEAKHFKKLKSRALGRYHIATIFMYQKNKTAFRAKKHIIPAIFYDPIILLNKGFLKVCLKSLFNIERE